MGPSDDTELIVFAIDHRRYALPAGVVLEVLHAVALTPLPDAPAIVLGVFDLRGRLVPVLDVRTRFRHASRPLQPADHFIVLLVDGRPVAFHVDRVLDFASAPADRLEDATLLAPGVRYVAAVARYPEGLVLIHDPHTFLSAEETEALEAALRALPPASA